MTEPTPPKGCPPIEGSCIEYSGYINKRGYGQYCTWVNGKVFSRNASRMKWLEINGEIPDGMHVLHRCDNRKCININHLFLGTNADNVADKLSKGRGAKGEMCKQSHLTDLDISVIRFLYSQGNSIRTLADWFGIKKSAMHKITSKQSWKHV